MHPDHRERINGQTRIAPAVRAAYIVGFTAVSVAIAVVASADFLDNFKNFVLVLLMVFTRGARSISPTTT